MAAIGNVLVMDRAHFDYEAAKKVKYPIDDYDKFFNLFGHGIMMFMEFVALREHDNSYTILKCRKDGTKGNVTHNQFKGYLDWHVERQESQ